MTENESLSPDDCCIIVVAFVTGVVGPIALAWFVRLVWSGGFSAVLSLPWVNLFYGSLILFSLVCVACVAIRNPEAAFSVVGGLVTLMFLFVCPTVTIGVLLLFILCRLPAGRN